MDTVHMKRLQEEQAFAIKQTDDKILQWEKFKSDYLALQERLSTLPDKMTHQVMVPFGSKAFMPGQLVHTNEILVLLGDNWFVDRSAKQAAEMVQRRIKSIEKEIHALKEQKKLLEPRLQFTSEMAQEGGYVDITEEFDPEKERLWKEQHGKNVRKERQKKKEVSHNASKEVRKPMTDDELWARLDELEIQESENREFQKMSEDEREESPEPKKPSRQELSALPRKVRWKDEVPSGEDSGDESDIEDLMDSDDYEDENGDENEDVNEDVNHIDSDDDDDEDDIASNFRENVTPIRISFTHTKDSSQLPDSDNSGSVNNPGDIYRRYGSGEKPKSILKKTEEAQDKKSVKLKKASERVRAADIKEPPAFSGKIVERSSDPVSVVVPPLPTDTQKTVAPTEAPKRVSKFKAQRQKNTETT